MAAGGFFFVVAAGTVKDRGNIKSMTRKLNVLDRLAILVTVLWLIGGTIGLGITQIRQQNQFTNTLYDLCISGYERIEKDYPQSDQSKGRARCLSDRDTNLAFGQSLTSIWWEAFLAALIAAGLFWGLIGVVAVLARWVLRGRSAKEAPSGND